MALMTDTSSTYAHSFDSNALSAGQTSVPRETPAISIKDYSFSYDPTKPILSQVCWEVPQGSFTLLVGTTGTGKSTLLRSLKPELASQGMQSGTICLFGQDINELDARASAELVGYVSQSPENQIVCDSTWHELAFGLENLGIAPEVMRRRVAEVTHFFGIEPWLDQSTDSLSGGQKQLLTLASVLALRPKILLLDEPTSQLDPVASKNFLHALFRVNREIGLTIVIVTHEPETVISYVTDMAELKNGAVVPVDIAQYRTDVANLAAQADFTLSAAPLMAGYAQLPVTVKVRDAYQRYERNLPFVLRGADLEVRQGTIHAIVGGNGAGKSTLLNVIATELKVARGTVQNRLADEQAYLPQNPKTLFVRDTVLEELQEWQHSAGYGQEDINRVVDRLFLRHVLDQHPYDLSGGQQQCLAFAKLVLTKPRLLLMDEPTKGLDVIRKFIIADNIIELQKQGVTVVMVTHDLAFAARVCDMVSLLFDGQIACTQTAGEFFEENLFYRPTIDAFFCAWDRYWFDPGHPGYEESGAR